MLDRGFYSPSRSVIKPHHLPNASFLRKPESGMVKFRPPQLKPGTLDAGMTAVTQQIPKNVVFTMALV